MDAGRVEMSPPVSGYWQAGPEAGPRRLSMAARNSFLVVQMSPCFPLPEGQA